MRFERTQIAWALYMDKSEDWVVRSFGHHPHVSRVASRSLLVFPFLFFFSSFLSFQCTTSNVLESYSNVICVVCLLASLQPHAIWYLGYWRHGTWKRSKNAISNLSITVNIILNRHPDYYVRICTGTVLYTCQQPFAFTLHSLCLQVYTILYLSCKYL